jgi:hypothetical protein
MFAIVYFAWSNQGQQVVGCPPCVRKQLRIHALVSLVMANVLFIIPVPIILLRIWDSHTDREPSIPVEYHHLANLPPPNQTTRASEARARRKRLFVVLLILALVGACLVFLLPTLADGR